MVVVLESQELVSLSIRQLGSHVREGEGPDVLNPLLETYLGITVADRSLTGGGSVRRTQEWHDVSCAHLRQETFVFDGMPPSEDIPFLDFSVQLSGLVPRFGILHGFSQVRVNAR